MIKKSFRKRPKNEITCINFESEKILTELVNVLQHADISLINTNEDGRVNSSLSEKTILDFLSVNEDIQNILVKYDLEIGIPKARAWFDFEIHGKNIFIPINIKISNLKQADNVSSKAGLYYACTGSNPNSPDDPSVNKWNVFYEQLSKNINFNQNSDYYFLIINKNDHTDVFYTSLKTLKTIVPNGNNLPFQCKWDENREENRQKNRTNKEACLFLINGFKKSLKRTLESTKLGIRTFNKIK